MRIQTIMLKNYKASSVVKTNIKASTTKVNTWKPVFPKKEEKSKATQKSQCHKNSSCNLVRIFPFLFFTFLMIYFTSSILRAICYKKALTRLQWIFCCLIKWYRYRYGNSSYIKSQAEIIALKFEIKILKHTYF